MIDIKIVFIITLFEFKFIFVEELSELFNIFEIFTILFTNIDSENNKNKTHK